MKLRRALATVAALAAAATTAITVAAPASAAGTCYAYTPSKVRIVSAQLDIPVTYGAGCSSMGGGTAYAEWRTLHPALGSEYYWDDFYFYPAGGNKSSWVMYDNAPLGRYTVRPFGGDANDGSYVNQNTSYTDVRLGSWSSIAATRSGTKVTLTTRTSRWGTQYSQVIPYGGITGLIQYWDRSKGAWAPLKNATQNSSGVYTYTYNATAGLSYRVVFPDAPYVWGTTSNTVYK